MSFGQKIAQFFANEILSKTLLKSQGFRQFVVKTHGAVTKVKETAGSAAAKVGEHQSVQEALQAARAKAETAGKAASDVSSSAGSSVFSKISNTWKSLDAEGAALKNNKK
eukprot:m.56826 g.56826  ORF g.56826 m.56826 type:complete len:110 (+) comp15594_c0_seq1:122-451(+)